MLGTLTHFLDREIYSNKMPNASDESHQLKTICIYSVVGIAIGLVQYVSEYFNQRSPIKYTSYAMSFFYSFFTVLLVKRSLPKINTVQIVIALSFILGVFIPQYINNFHVVFLSSSVFIFLYVALFDKVNKYKWTHFACVGVIIATCVLFEIVVFDNSEVHSFFKIILIIVGSASLSFAFLSYQYTLKTGVQFYNYIELQGGIGFLFFAVTSVIGSEHSSLVSLSGEEGIFVCLDSISWFLFMILIPFYSKKCNAVISILFFYWKYFVFSYGEANVVFLVLVNIIFGGACFGFFYFKIPGETKRKEKSDKNIDFFAYDDIGKEIRSDMQTFNYLNNTK